MRILLTTMLMAGLLWTPTPALAETRESFDRVIAGADLVQFEALEIRRLLRERNTDDALLHQRMSVLDQHARTLKNLLVGLQGDTSLTATQRVAVDRATLATDTMLVMLTNKAAILADADRAAKQRRLLRDKADGVAKRAEMVERQLSTLIG